jgi:translation initiation factor 3 subunit D
MVSSLLDIVKGLPNDNSWGPPITSDTTLNGVPYAPFSKGDRLGRMADWTEGKDRERGGRQQYGNRGYRGEKFFG